MLLFLKRWQKGLRNITINDRSLHKINSEQHRQSVSCMRCWRQLDSPIHCSTNTVSAASHRPESRELFSAFFLSLSEVNTWENCSTNRFCHQRPFLCWSECCSCYSACFEEKKRGSPESQISGERGPLKDKRLSANVKFCCL